MQLHSTAVKLSFDDCFHHAEYLAITVMYSRMIEQTILTGGLTPTQYRILIRINAYDHTLRIGQLAEMLDMGASAVTGAVAQLEDEGAVIRADSSRDKRGVCVFMTEWGAHQTSHVDGKLRPLLEDIRDDFPLDLRRYASICTLNVAKQNKLFGSSSQAGNVNTALCDEILQTAALMHHVTRDEGLSMTAYRLLLELMEYPGGAHPGDLGRILAVKANMIASTQNELLKRELIKRSRDPLDRRSVVIEMTSKGYNVLRSCSLAMRNALQTEIIEGLTPLDFDKHHRLAKEILQVRCADGQLRITHNR